MELYRNFGRGKCISHILPTLKDPSGLKPAPHRSRRSLFSVDTFWRSHGIFGSIVEEADKEKGEACTTLNLGACLPSWAAWTEIALSCSFSRHPRDGLRLYGSIGVHFRVAHTSPLMAACEKGDVVLIRQILNNRLGAVNDRSAYQGLTPLLVIPLDSYSLIRR